PLGHFGETGRHAVERVPVTPARFKKEYGDVLVFAEAIGEHAARRAAADNDVVERLGHCLLLSSVIASEAKQSSRRTQRFVAALLAMTGRVITASAATARH